MLNRCLNFHLGPNWRKYESGRRNKDHLKIAYTTYSHSCGNQRPGLRRRGSVKEVRKRKPSTLSKSTISPFLTPSSIDKYEVYEV